MFEADRILRFHWTDPKSLARSDYELDWLTRPEPIDFDWYEPTTEWRRENARWREQFGGAKFGRPSPPVEGPNNPDRLRRELETAEADLRVADVKIAEARDDRAAALDRATKLRERLA